MNFLLSARSDRLGEAINVAMIKTINIRASNDETYLISVQIQGQTEEEWLCITNDMSLKMVQKAYKELIAVLRSDMGYDDWSKEWLNFGNKS